MLKELLQRFLNISPAETPRTAYAWAIRFLLKTGIVIGWTTVMAMFVTRYSLSNLPFLFLVQATFTILGMLFFSFFLERFSARVLLTISASLAGVIFLIATFFHTNDLVFFCLSIFAYGLFIPQVIIFLSNYIEDFFSPMECQKVFPIAESAETIGGIIAGIVLSNIGAGFMGYKLMYLWIAFIFLFLVAVYAFCPKGPSEHEKKNIRIKKKSLHLHGFQKGIKEIQRIPFLQTLLVVFFIQWIIAYLLEFQFTKIVEEAAGGPSLHEHEANLTHGLGSFHIILHGSALMVQLLLASRILKFLGTFGGFLLHSLVTLLSVFSLFLGFNYFTAVLARNNFEITGIIHRNSYEASYYGFRHGMRRSVREFFEGFIFPLSTMAGTIIIIGIQTFFLKEHFVPAVQLFLFFAVAGMTFFSFHLQKSYTRMVRKLLLFSSQKKAMLHAIEILVQKGHKDSKKVLMEGLRKCEDDDVKKKIIEALGMIQTS